MDIFLDLFKTKNSTIMIVAIPSVRMWVDHIEAFYILFLALGVFFTLITITLAAVHLYFVYRYISRESIQSDLYWLIYLCPIVSLCGCAGMIIPRAATFLYAVALVYFMLCIFVTVTLMTTLNGGRRKLVEKLLAKDKKINMRILPLGCWLFWVPKLTPTHAVFRRIEWLVFQSPILRIFMEILNIIVYMEIGHRTNIFFSITSVLGIISLFVASWGSYMIIPLGSSLLKNYRLSFMFHLVDTAQLVYSVQKFIFDFLVGVDIIQSDEFLPAQSKALYWMCFLLTLEMFVVSIIATFAFRPSQTEFFDKFNRLSHNRLQGSNEFSCSRNISTESIENNFHTILPSTKNNNNDGSTKSVQDFEITNITSIEKSPRFHTVIGGGGNESGLGSVSISSESVESENIDDYPSMDVERRMGAATNFDENEINENDLIEINLNSSRSEKNLHNNKF